jgi:TonB family protein
MQGQKRMEVRVLNNYSKRRWFNLWMQSISINNSRETFSKSAQDLITLMQAAKSAPQKGDFIEYLSSPDQGTSMRFNGTELVADLPAEVFGLLLNTWIGAIPPTTSFKDEILGKERNPAAVELLETVVTDPQRVTLAASWTLPPEPVVVSKVKPKAAIEKNLKAKASAPAKPKVTPAPLENKLPEAVTAVAAIAAVTTKSAAAKQQSAVAKPTAASANSKNSDLAKTTAEATLASNDAEDEVDFSIAEALAMRDYTPLVVQQIYKKISYPSRAIDRGYEGTVRMAIVVSKSGALENVTVAQESKHSILNKAAIKATERAAPFPELPADLNTDHFEITVPITFKLK